MNAFMFHVCAGRPYTTFVTTHSKLFYPYLSYCNNVECGNQFSSSWDSSLILLLHLAHVQYLHTGQLVGSWNRLETELLTRLSAGSGAGEWCRRGGVAQGRGAAAGERRGRLEVKFDGGVEVKFDGCVTFPPFAVCAVHTHQFSTLPMHLQCHA
jgi:hypothetical protein